MKLAAPNNRGFSALSAMVAILVIAATIQTLFRLAANNTSLRSTELAGEQAFYTAHAGIEFALRQSRVDGDPQPVPARDFAGKPLSISYTSACASGRNISSTGTNQSASASFALTAATTSSPCLTNNAPPTLSWASSSTVLNGFQIKRVSPACDIKNFYITGAKISWTPNAGEKIKTINIKASTAEYSNTTGLVSGSVFDFGTRDFLVNNSGWNAVALTFNANMSGKKPLITIQWYITNLPECSQTQIQAP